MKNTESLCDSSSKMKAHLRHQSPELLLPVGSKEMALAAIHNGADAIYVGVPGFNARGRTHDFAMAELKEIIELCHLYDVKVNLAFNIVIFQNEIPKVLETLYQILPLRPDAFIVQDLGLLHLIRQIAPTQRIHASTQMTITNSEAIRLLEDLHIQRFVLGRENSIKDIQNIRSDTDHEIEVFVHGALCVSYSGQCFTSESLGGRSANRGQCAQSCRLGYELYANKEKINLENKKYLVSPQDLCGLEEIPDLIAAGVDCLKVEGRLKTTDYVATVGRNYRRAIDLALQGRPLPFTDKAQALRQMATTYSRGFFRGWLRGVDHQSLVQGEFSSHRGAPVGRIIETFKNQMTMEVLDDKAIASLIPGDGLAWSSKHGEQGGFIYQIHPLPKKRLHIEFARGLRLKRGYEGVLVFQNHDKELKKKVAQSVEDKMQRKRLPIAVAIDFQMGHPLKAQLTLGSITVKGETPSPTGLAQKKGISDEDLRQEFSSLTGSLFQIGDFLVQRSSNESLFLPFKEVKNLRQNLIEELTNLKRVQSQNQNPIGPSSTVALELKPQNLAGASLGSSGDSVRFHVLLRDKEQVFDLVEAVKEGSTNDLVSKAQSIGLVTLDFEFGRDYGESVKALREVGLRVGIATTRVLKPKETRNIKAIIQFEPDVILVRNLGALYYLMQNHPGRFELLGDFSLNVTNQLSAKYLLSKGLNQLTLSYDLNNQQICELLEATGGRIFEATIFQYMPSFHMEHCVFASTLSQGSSYLDCGKPCEKFEVELRDQFDNWHQIKADQECRNTMYNAKAQSAARFAQEWLQRGLGSIRYEALKERGPELLSKIRSHIDFIEGRKTGLEVQNELGAEEHYGLTEGGISRSTEYQSRKKEIL